MSTTSTLHLDQIPGDKFLVNCLQKQIIFSINNKTIKKGKLLLYKRAHYFVQFTLMSDKGNREHVDVPFPFKVESYEEDNLLYFDYRIKSLDASGLPKLPDKPMFVYFDKILEIQAS